MKVGFIYVYFSGCIIKYIFSLRLSNCVMCYVNFQNIQQNEPTVICLREIFIILIRLGIPMMIPPKTTMENLKEANLK